MHKRKILSQPIKLDLKNSFFKDSTVVQLLVSWDKLFQSLGALNEKALSAPEFDGLYVFREILADDREALLGLHNSI